MGNTTGELLRPASWQGDHPFFRSLELTVEHIGDGEAVLTTPTPARFANKGGEGGLHGGSYGAFCSAGAEIAAASVLEPGLAASFVEYRVQIFRRLVGGTTGRITATLQQRGRRYLGAEVDIANAEGKVCAHMTATLAVEPARGLVSPAPTLPPPVPPPGFWYEESESWGTWRARTTETSPGFGRVTSYFDPEFAGVDGALHPGFIASVADSVTVPACATVKADDETYTTLEYKVNFLRPIFAGPLRADGRVAGRDHRAFVVDVEVRDEADQLCAKMLTSLAVLKTGGWPREA